MNINIWLRVRYNLSVQGGCSVYLQGNTAYLLFWQGHIILNVVVLAYVFKMYLDLCSNDANYSIIAMAGANQTRPP